MNIGQASKASGISSKAIRYYERIGLLPQAGRTDGGYRDYGPDDIHRLRFVRRARDLGFSFERVRELLRLWSDQKRSRAKVKELALAHISELEARAAELNGLIDTLRQLADTCDGSNRPDCPIIEDLEGGTGKRQPNSFDGGSTPSDFPLHGGSRARVVTAEKQGRIGLKGRVRTTA